MGVENYYFIGREKERDLHLHKEKVNNMVVTQT